MPFLKLKQEQIDFIDYLNTLPTNQGICHLMKHGMPLNDEKSGESYMFK